mgnify:CR=1 FL=1
MNLTSKLGDKETVIRMATILYFYVMIQTFIWTRRMFKSSDRALDNNEKFLLGFLAKKAFVLVRYAACCCFNTAAEMERDAKYYRVNYYRHG